MNSTTTLTITFKPVTQGLPPQLQNPQNRYSLQCLAIVNGEIYDGAIRYDFDSKAWVWGDLSLGDDPKHYQNELGGNRVEAWAFWPSLASKSTGG